MSYDHGSPERRFKEIADGLTGNRITDLARRADSAIDKLRTTVQNMDEEFLKEPEKLHATG